MMHRESIHRYLSPRCLVTSAACWKVLDEASKVIDRRLSCKLASVVMSETGFEPQQWLRVAYFAFFPFEMLRRTADTESPTSITLVGKRGSSPLGVDKHSACFVRHL